ncbi:hypothetical protein F9B85_10255 [Heliorestis acidaminivorans]|uniref:Uncharacterized protein n=1 Tax=Heliorestis acidaminivorans TaxID=553427 RepID=A0A6I0ESP4_9FIRM|nr:hypothetical protein [Heliorestis acidaminivorans]KAB2951931.1 hypothetical protein F9B85_10255 [Heliorestis acidaminivorans]
MIYLYEAPCDPKVISQKITGPRLDLTHPRLGNFTDYSIEESVNEQIKHLVHQTIESQSYGQDEDPVMITGRYKVNLNTRYLLSLSQEFFFHKPDIEQAESQLKSITFDLNTGEKLKISKLLSTEKALEEIFQSFFLLKEKKHFDEDGDYYISFNTLVLFLKGKEVYIPLSKLRKWISLHSPLQRLLVNS